MTKNEIPSGKEWTKMVRSHFPEVKNWDEVMDVLWNLTAYPFMGNQREPGFTHYDKQLKELSDRSGKDLGKAYDISEKEIDDAMREANTKP